MLLKKNNIIYSYKYTADISRVRIGRGCVGIQKSINSSRTLRTALFYVFDLTDVNFIDRPCLYTIRLKQRERSLSSAVEDQN